jgi:DNA-binding NarL/FixJ family response regulator
MVKSRTCVIIFSTHGSVTLALTSWFEQKEVDLTIITTSIKKGFDTISKIQPNLLVLVTNSTNPTPEYLKSIKSIDPSPSIVLIIDGNATKYHDRADYCDLICQANKLNATTLENLMSKIQPDLNVSIKRAQCTPPILTKKQQEILQYLVNGREPAEIHRILGVSQQAVHVHIKKLHEAFGTESLHKLILLSLRSGLVD